MVIHRPAQFAGLLNKGSIRKGFDADLVVWNPNESMTVTPESTLHRNKQTPYGSWSLQGRVHTTYLRGKPIFENGKITGKPRGLPLLKD